MSLVEALLLELDDDALCLLAERLAPHLAEHLVDSDRLLTPCEAARKLGIHTKTLTRAAAAGRVAGAVRVGRGWRFHADELRLAPPAESAITPTKPARPRSAASTAGAVDAIRGQR